MFRINFDSMFIPGKLVGYHIVFNTTKKKDVILEKLMIFVHVMLTTISAARAMFWAINHKPAAVKAFRMTGIEIVFKVESRSLTPVFNMIYLYQHRRKFLRINKYMRCYYDHLTEDQKDQFGFVFWTVVLLEVGMVASEVYTFLAWSLALVAFQGNLNTYIIDVFSIMHSVMWYLVPMLQYYLFIYILTQSLHNSCSHLRMENLDLENLKCIALNMRSVTTLCDLVNELYGKTVLFGILCSSLEIVFFPYVYVSSTYFLRIVRDDQKFLLASISAIVTVMKLVTIFPLFQVCENFYQQKQNIRSQLSEILANSKSDDRLHRQVYYLYLRYVHEDSKIFAAGIMELSYKQLTSILTSTAAFFILQIQFIMQDGY